MSNPITRAKAHVRTLTGHDFQNDRLLREALDTSDSRAHQRLAIVGDVLLKHSLVDDWYTTGDNPGITNDSQPSRTVAVYSLYTQVPLIESSRRLQVTPTLLALAARLASLITSKWLQATLARSAIVSSPPLSRLFWARFTWTLEMTWPYSNTPWRAWALLQPPNHGAGESLLSMDKSITQSSHLGLRQSPSTQLQSYPCHPGPL